MSEQTETTPKQNIFKRLKPAGWLALGVLAVLVVGLLGNGYRAVFGVNRLQPLETPRPAAPDPTAADAAPTTTPAATPTALPTPDPDEAWETFMEAIYKCDALPDKGDDLAAYPETLEELTEGIEDLTTDEEWIEWCSSDTCTTEDTVCHGLRLAKFGPQNLKCQDLICEVAVSVQSKGVLVLMIDPPTVDGKSRMLVRPPQYKDATPLRLIKGQVEYQPEEDAWVITNMEITVLSEPPESPCDDCDS